ncbi:hypothetical protein [Chryseobacterium sp. MEBOG07]|uniref:hypothetical protein n=1 Tax=Chryseobacterium sp. MEBOG07 TaxID=2879939 RepID=UPI001F47DB92|nr:hypothetical protein [Chryseobacterium sp. MEBOG07]UKB78342.1 hypothetical protein LF886_17925 [Chryseobacterium sp. MEBOG07]
MKKKVTFLFILMTLKSFSQVGINTRYPQASLHVDGGSNNPSGSNPSALEYKDDVVFTSSGKLGVGIIKPIAKLDLRGAANTNNSIGIGQTTQSPDITGADAGALRYATNNAGNLEYSDGTVWYRLNSNSPKIGIVERINTAITVPYQKDIPLTKWNEVSDITNSFDQSTGVFSAPRSGAYLVTITYNFNDPSTALVNNAYSEARFIKNGDITNPVKRCLKTFGETSATSQQIGGYCMAVIQLSKNDTLSLHIFQNLANKDMILRWGSAVTDNNFGFNNFSIIEQ